MENIHPAGCQGGLAANSEAARGKRERADFFPQPGKPSPALAGRQCGDGVKFKAPQPAPAPLSTIPEGSGDTFCRVGPRTLYSWEHLRETQPGPPVSPALSPVPLPADGNGCP